eukprot:3363292-Amphidinium_carterae.1
MLTWGCIFRLVLGFMLRLLHSLQCSWVRFFRKVLIARLSPGFWVDLTQQRSRRHALQRTLHQDFHRTRSSRWRRPSHENAK